MKTVNPTKLEKVLITVVANRDELEHEDKEASPQTASPTLKDKLGIVAKESPLKKKDPLAGNVWPYDHETK